MGMLQRSRSAVEGYVSGLIRRPTHQQRYQLLRSPSPYLKLVLSVHASVAPLGLDEPVEALLVGVLESDHLGVVDDGVRLLKGRDLGRQLQGEGVHRHRADQVRDLWGFPRASTSAAAGRRPAPLLFTRWTNA